MLELCSNSERFFSCRIDVSTEPDHPAKPNFDLNHNPAGNFEGRPRVRGHLIFGLPQCGIPVQPVFRGGALLRKVAVDFLWKKGWDSAPGQPPPEVETVGGAGRGEEFLLQRPSLLIAQPSEQLRASA